MVLASYFSFFFFCFFLSYLSLLFVFAKLTQKDEVTQRQTNPLIVAEDVLGTETFSHKEGGDQRCSGLRRAVGVARRRRGLCHNGAVLSADVLSAGWRKPLAGGGPEVQTPLHPALGAGPGPEV